MSSLLIKNADAIVTCDSQDAVLEHANLLMQDGIITYLGIARTWNCSTGLQHCTRFGKI